MRRSLVSALATAALCTALAAPASAQTRKIVIDPGHGGSDPGGTGNGLQEKNIVLDVGTRFKQLLDADTADTGRGGSWIALRTRTDDTFVSLAARSAFANAEDADRFMSIHSNAFANAQANGTETFSFSEGSQGAALRNLVQEEMIAAWGLTNRGNKVANFAVLRQTAMPAVLHELAFITNATDAAKLGSEIERQKAAVAHLRAIQRHFGIAPFVPGTSEGTTVGQIVGRVVDDLGPVEGATVALGGGPQVVTPADGSFVFTQVPAGSPRLTVTAPGYEDTVVDLQLAADQSLETEVVLTRTGPGPGEDDGGSGGDDGGGPDDDGAGDDGPGDDGAEDGPDDGADSGGELGGSDGCRAAGSRSAGALPLVLLGLAVAFLLRRRRG